MAEAPTILRWRAYEHEHVVRGRDWFWALGIIALSAAITAILFHDMLFAIVVVLAAATIGMLANVPPDLIEFELSDRGIRVGDTLHRFDEILAFWVEDEKGEAPVLLVDTEKFMSPNLIIPIQQVDPKDVRTFLQTRTTEVPMREPVAHKVLEFFGF